ncbi:hypothetical protein ABTJ31_18775, partial [Acinetobacter baumannii]
WEPDHNAKHETLFFTESIFTDIIKNSFLSTLQFFQPGGQHVIQTSREQTSQIKSLFAAISAFKNQPTVMPGLIYSLLMLAQTCHQSVTPVP